MTPLDHLISLENPAKAAEMAAYHKTTRRCLGIPVPVLTDLAKGWREGRDVAGRVALAQELWGADIHETRIAAAKLLVQARIAGDGPIWDLIASWVPDFDGWAIADHVCDAGNRRLLADPSRLDEVERWTTSPHMWTRRAAMVITLPWTKQNFPKPQDLAVRDRVLGWAAHHAGDHDWFIQKSVAWWLRSLSDHDAPRVLAFMDANGDRMKPWAAKEATRHLKDSA